MLRTFSITCLLMVTVVIPLSASGATIVVDPTVISHSQNLVQGEEFLLPIYLDTQGELINALEGTILFPQDILSVKEIREGNSTLNFWIERPHIVRDSSGREGISFSGITPGGMSGAQHYIFSVVLKVDSVGQGRIQSESLRALRNDGTGTSVRMTMSPINVSVTQAKEGEIRSVPPIEDTQPPDEFNPVIVSDPNIFEGKGVVLFTSQDKGVGIDHYEVREGRFGRFVTAESPYILTNQDLNQRVYIKAIDKNGNSTIVSIAPLRPTGQYQYYVILSIIILVVSGVVFVIKKLWRKSTR